VLKGEEEVQEKQGIESFSPATAVPEESGGPRNIGPDE
jgi:hypothetical protein